MHANNKFYRAGYREECISGARSGFERAGHAQEEIAKGTSDRFFCEPLCLCNRVGSHPGRPSLGAVLDSFGHTVRLVAPQFVKPYLGSQKKDANDAAAICEAVSRPHMRFVSRKTVEQQDLQALHRVRSRLIRSRTQLGNQIRGLLAEYGIVLPQRLSHVRAALPQRTEENETRLSGFAKRLFATMYEELCALDERISAVEGIGPVTATAVVAAISDGSTFRNGRQFAAWCPGSIRVEKNSAFPALRREATVTCGRF